MGGEMGRGGYLPLGPAAQGLIKPQNDLLVGVRPESPLAESQANESRVALGVPWGGWEAPHLWGEGAWSLPLPVLWGGAPSHVCTELCQRAGGPGLGLWGNQALRTHVCGFIATPHRPTA